jgi:hypothetical protein
MMRWVPLLVFLFECASSGVPNATADRIPEVGGDEAGFGGGLVSGDTPPGDDGIGAMPAGGSSSAPPASGPAVSAGVEASTDELEIGLDATPDTSEDPAPWPPFDPGDAGVCSGALAPGDLIIDELMIQSVAGAGDHGEWIEVQSTVGCALDLRGLHGDAPSGNKIRTFDIGSDVWIPALGTFIVADSSNAAIDHQLPGTEVAWAGQPGDVLRNKGGTVTLLAGGMMIDTLTYPSMALTVGTSVTFPSDCAPSRRSDWTAWQPSAFEWFPGFFGTPNAPNDDVQCP